MTEVSVDEQGRPEPPLAAGETETLLGFLDFQRATLEWKTRGVDDAGLRRRLEHPSSMTLGGLLKHLVYVESFWFLLVMDQQDPEQVWRASFWGADLPEPTETWEWESAARQSGAELREMWQGAVERSRAVVTEQVKSGGLGQTYPAWGGKANPSLRWILVHLIEEYARHNGHADLLREIVDGETGE